MVGQRRVRVVVEPGVRVDVHDRVGEPRQSMEQFVTHVLRNPVSVCDGQLGWDGDLDLGVQSVTDPANPNVPDRNDIGGGGAGASDRLDQVGVDGVEESSKHVTGGFDEQVHDHGSDDESGDRVRDSSAKRDSGSADSHADRGESVGAGMYGVGDESG